MTTSDDLETRLLAARLAAARQAQQQPPSGSPPQVVTAADGTRMVLDPATGSYTNAELMAGNLQPGVGMSALSGAVNGGTFGWGDEIAAKAGVDPLVVERARATTAAGMRDHPVASIGGNVVGGVLMAAPAVAAMPEAITGGSLLTQTAVGAATGAGLGALQGAGEANPGERLHGAAVGGIIGTVAGAASPYLAAGVKGVTGAVLARLKNTDIAGISNALGIGKDAAKIIRAHLQNDDTQAAMDALDKAGPQAMIADSSPAAAQLLDSTVAAGGPAQRIAADAVDLRSSEAGLRLVTAMDNILGGAPDGIKSAARAVATRTAKSREAAYSAAYSSPIDYADTTGMNIEAVLSRIPPKQAAAAIQEANDAMREAGIQNRQIMVQIAQNGDVVFQEMPNVQQLDYIKRGLDAVKRAETDPVTGKVSDAGRRAARLAADLRSAIGDAVPEYARAVKLGGDKIAEEEALKLGRSLLSTSVTRETVKEAMDGASVEARLAAKQGLRTAFDEAMANVKAIASDPAATDARAALKAVKDFSSEANRTKAEMIMGKPEAQRLFAAFDQAATQLALKSAIATNSKTAARLAGKEAMDAIQSNPMRDLKAGNVAAAMRGLVQMLTGATPAAQTAERQKIYAEVAQALTSIQGPQAKLALNIVQRAISGTPATDRQAQIVARALTLLGASGGYHAMQKALTAPSGVPQ